MRTIPTEILDALHLPADVATRRLLGNENENYLVSIGDQAYVIKRILNYTADNVQLEGVYRHYLAEAGLPVAPYLHLKHDSYVVSVDSGVYAAAPYINGSPADNSAETVYTIASELARIHLLDASPLPPRLGWFRKSYIPDSLAEVDAQYATAQSDFKAHYKHIPALWDAPVPQGIVHGDLHGDNFIMAKDGTVASILDWEEAMVGPLVLDAAHALRSLAFRDDACDEHLAAAFLDGYQQVRPLTKIERELFEPALQYSALVLSVWAHIKKSRGHMSDELFARLGTKYLREYRLPYGVIL